MPTFAARAQSAGLPGAGSDHNGLEKGQCTTCAPSKGDASPRVAQRSFASVPLHAPSPVAAIPADSTGHARDVPALEHEADRFAAAHATPVHSHAASTDVRAASPTHASTAQPALSRGAARHLVADSNPLMRATIAAGVATPAEPVPHGVLQRFAPALQTDLRHARLHRDPSAHAFARMIGAHAFAHGGDIVLGQQASDLQGAAGRHAVAHELAHVVHQAPWQGRTGTSATLFSMQTYIKAMNAKPEPDWATAAEHLNGEKPDTIKQVLKQLPAHHRVKLHEAARTWPGLCSNIGRMSEADYLKEHPEAGRAADVCNQPAAASPPQAQAQAAPAAPIAPSTELTDKDASTCSPLYLQKLCVYLIGGFNGDRSGVETPEDMANYNRTCRTESGYDGPDISLSDADRATMKAPKCARGDPDAARERVAKARLAAVLNRSAKYMPGGGGEQLLALLNDDVFIGSLVAAVGAYLLLWAIPEPVFSKIAAVATTIVVLSSGAFTVSTIRNLAEAWGDVTTDAQSATSDELIEAAAERFGKRMGAITVDLLIFLASLLIGGKLPTPRGLPNAAKAIGDAERVLAAAKPGGVLIEGPWGRLQSVEPLASPASPRSGSVSGPSAGREATAFKFSAEPAPVRPPLRLAQPAPAPAARAAAPAEAAPLTNLRRLPVPEVRPAPVPEPVPAPATAPAPAADLQPVPLPPLLPGTGPQTSAPPQIQPQPQPQPQPRRRPPFVLRLPQQKAPHLMQYRLYLPYLQSDPAYQRGNPGQLEQWHMALRLGGSHGIPAEVYERGHRMGLTGETGERRIRVPNWSRTGSKAMEVDHIIELQVTPPDMRDIFNAPDNFELLDKAANGSAGPQLSASIAAERAIQVAHDPSLANQVLHFESVVMGGGFDGERWSIDAIRAGRQLDFYENDHAP